MELLLVGTTLSWALEFSESLAVKCAVSWEQRFSQGSLEGKEIQIPEAARVARELQRCAFQSSNLYCMTLGLENFHRNNQPKITMTVKTRHNRSSGARCTNYM